MRRLFWKFFLTIWLTMAVSVVALFTITKALQIEPFPREVEVAKRDFATAIINRLLAEKNVGSATTVARAAEKELAVNGIMVISDPSANGSKIDVAIVEPGLIDYVWPRLFPWVSIVLAAAIAAYWLARNLVRPITHIRNGLSALAHGRFDVRISDEMAGRRDELAELAADFDTTATRLEDLRLSQRRLFSDVSHELRSPLSRLQASLGVIEQNPARLSAMIERISREIERMDGLIGEILTLARLSDRSDLPIERQTVDLIDLLQEIVVDAAFEAQTRSIKVDFRGPEHFIAKVNGELIYRAFENVIRNAVKYTAVGSRVSVEAEIEDQVLVLSVVDQGPGLHESELDWIFQPFSRSQNAEPDGGFGLGLAIAKQAIESHGGSITATPASTGGLAMVLKIPSCNQ
ncbi:hypothetical protein SAMN02745157_4392 [Kaistia soli DSM 19436]|uniref:histidine kinase n=1 Tax=Kaistia soli DSM 19436 TaxID=1122133 RepID=A0A1M5KHB1_9HYPH|nr:ATP-binding protein [Kaistia soli]SHG52118.1 hypothetical protein SAMN02745157_4392 [Kaistia soli DSM 19436]